MLTDCGGVSFHIRRGAEGVERTYNLANNDAVRLSRPVVADTGEIVSAVVHLDQAVEVAVGDRDGNLVSFLVAVPQDTPEPLSAVVTWDRGEVRLYINDTLFASRKLPAHGHSGTATGSTA